MTRTIFRVIGGNRGIHPDFSDLKSAVTEARNRQSSVIFMLVEDENRNTIYVGDFTLKNNKWRFAYEGEL